MDVQDLEQLRQMDEEIIEMQKETERELQQKNQELLAAVATVCFMFRLVSMNNESQNFGNKRLTY
jgi:hypothetical protein